MDAHILAIETSSSLCGVALLARTEQGIRIYHQEHEGTGDHAERLLPMIQAVLDQAGLPRNRLTAVAFGQGPGGFTGLRVACGIAQGIAYALKVPVLPVSTLLAAAWRDCHQQACAQPHVHLVVQDARMNEIYAAVYRRDTDALWQTVLPAVLIGAAVLPAWAASLRTDWGLSADQVLHVSGDALAAFASLRTDMQQAGPVQCATAQKADAIAVAHLALADWDQGKSVAPEHAAPLYVRDKVAFTIQERGLGRGGNPAAQDQAWQLQRMHKEHLPRVLDIERQVQITPWSAQNFQDALQANYHMQIVMAQGNIMGFAVSLAAPDVMQLLLIGVSPDAQGKGAGRLLMEQAEQKARELGLPGMMLEVRTSNVAAQAFYDKLGYTLTGRRKNYYQTQGSEREDALILSKSWSTEV